MGENTLKTQTYRVYPVRWIILVACMLLVSGCHMAWLTFSPVQYKCASWMGGEYAAHPEKLDIYGTISFPITFVFGFIGAYLFDRYGSYIPLMIGGWSLTPACALRVAACYVEDADTRHVMFIVAQAFGGISTSMLSLSPTKIAAVWFAENQRTLANTAVTLMLPGGILIAYVLSPPLVDLLAVENEDGTKNFDLSFQVLMWFYFVWNLIGTLLITFFMSNPGVPPSPASPTSEQPVLPFFKGVWTALKNPMYLLIVGAMACGMGLVSVIEVELPTIMCPWGFNDIFASSYSITILNVSGTVSSFFFAVVIDKYGTDLVNLWGNKKITVIELIPRILMIGTAIGSIGFAFYSTQQPGYWGFSIFTAILGSFAYPILPISYELSVETTYPVGPATSAGLNWVFASLAAIVMELVFSPLKQTMEGESGRKSNITSETNVCVQEGAGLIDDNGNVVVVVDHDFRYSLLAIVGITWVFGILWFSLYKCPFKRRSLDDEGRKEGNKILVSGKVGSEGEDNLEFVR